MARLGFTEQYGKERHAWLPVKYYSNKQEQHEQEHVIENKAKFLNAISSRRGIG